MKFWGKLKSKAGKTEEWYLVNEEEAKRLGLPPAYKEGPIRPLESFIHGEELVARREANRQKRRQWAFRYLTGRDEDDQ